MVLARNLRQEIATSRRNVVHPVYGGDRLYPQDETLIHEGGRGFLAYDIYTEIAKDCHAYAVLQKRFMAVVGREWEVLPGQRRGSSSTRQEKKAADMLKAQLEGLSVRSEVVEDRETTLTTAGNFDEVCWNLLWAIHYGWQPAELIWDQDGSEAFVSEAIAKDLRRFVMVVGQRGFKLRMLDITGNLIEGVPLPHRKFIVHRFASVPTEDPYGLGLGTRLFYPTFFKRQDIKFWLQFADKFASPTAVAKYPRGSTEADKKEYLAMLDAIATDAGIAIPADVIVEFLESERASALNTYKDLAAFCDGEISKAVLGETGTTDQQGSGGSRARDQVGDGVRIEVAKGDSDLLSATLNRTLCNWVSWANFGPDVAPPTVWRKFPELAEKEDLNTRATRDNTIASASGRTITEKYWVDTYGVAFEPKEPAQDPNAPPDLSGAFGPPPGAALDAPPPPDGATPPADAAALDAPPALNLEEQLCKPCTVEHSDAAAESSTAWTVGDAPAGDIADFARLKMAGNTKQRKNCTKGWSCGYTCLGQDKKTCKSPLQGQVAKYADWLEQQAGGSALPSQSDSTPSVASQPAPVAPVQAKSMQGVQVNQAALDRDRVALVAAVGEEVVKLAEESTQKILNSEQVGLFVKIPNDFILKSVLGDRFRNSLEQGKPGDVPGLAGDYADGRRKVEAEILGYDASHDDSNRPIYAYFGDSGSTGSATHADVSAFGQVTVRLRDDLKQRATFTGSDSFKGGIASQVVSDAPPPPNAASLVGSTRHGDHQGIPDSAADTLKAVGAAKNIDDLMNATATGGNRYVEAQVHGGVKPGDIAELHFDSRSDNPIPTKAVRDWAANNDVKIFKDGSLYEHHEVSSDRRKELAKTTPQELSAYIQRKALRSRQTDPGAAHNLTLEQWQAKQESAIYSNLDEYPSIKRAFEYLNDPGSSKALIRIAQKTIKDEFAQATSPANYGSTLRESVAEGLHLSPAAAASWQAQKRTKAAQKDVNAIIAASDSNKSTWAQSVARDRDIDAVLDEPHIDGAAVAGYRPKMSKAEAEKYTAQSAFAGQDFFHGGPSFAVDDISTNGVKISANQAGMFGAGFYMGATREIADSYAGNNENKVAAARVKASNPLVFDTNTGALEYFRSTFGGEDRSQEEIDRYQEAFNGRFGAADTAAWSMLAKLRGNDAIYVKESGYLIVQDPRQVAVYDVSSANADAVRDAAAKVGANYDYGLSNSSAYQAFAAMQGLDGGKK